jgi:geranylgeranyl diphosphate synthase type I
MSAEPPAALASHAALIENALRESLREGPPELINASRYVMGWQDYGGAPAITGGKRIRPALCLFGATLFGARPEVALPGAVAVELIHNFSLVHDEVQDHDAERHHRPTLWALLGEGQAINAGDFLITRATEALLSGDGPADRRLAALQVLNVAMAHMIAGQWADISFETRMDVTPDDYLEMVRGKTGALLGAPLAMGAILAGAPLQQAETMGRWGETVGLAFQVQDDYLGIWGDPNRTGKSNTNDIARRKKTLPIVHGLSSDQADAIREVYESEDQGAAALARVVSALKAAGADSFCRERGQDLVAQADALLESFELPQDQREHLRAVGRYLVDRDR